MKSANEQINIPIKTIENEQVPDWVKQHTVWVESKSDERNVTMEESTLRLRM